MYSREEVRKIIDEYKTYSNIIQAHVYDDDSTSTAQYGIEAVMPKAKGQVGDKVYNKVMERNKGWHRNVKLLEKIQLIDESEEYITDEINFHLLQMLKQGFKHITIMDVLCISRGKFYKRVNQIVDVVMDYQQQHKL